jgi:NAD(P)-dependent dehydrogenase (short-subunit alcohol dehydrogenase family)
MPLPPAELITGCASGIGHATARRLALRRRWTVYATARRVSDLADLEADGCRTLRLDVTDEASMVAAVRAIEAEHGQVSVLVNNAGYSQSGAVEAIAPDRVRAQFETNVFGLIRLSQLVLPAMRAARSGRILLLSSMGGRLVFPGGGLYHATKHAVEALGDAMRFELGGFGIKVVLIEPGLIQTNFGDAASAGLPTALDEAYGDFHATVARMTREAAHYGRSGALAGTPEDVARVIERAMTTGSPRPRYAVSPSARLFMWQRRWLGDRAWDWFLDTIFPRPGQRDGGIDPVR